MEATIEDFGKLDIRIATIVAVEDHPNAEKLYILKWNVGSEERQVVAGMKGYYSKEEPVGKQIAFVYNLKPAVIRGAESQGMILAADDGKGKVVFLMPERKIENGSKVR